MANNSMLNLFFLFAFSRTAVAADVVAFLDMYEMDHVHYAVVIDGKPIKIASAGKDLLTEASLDGGPKQHSILPMTNKFGQKYSCILPDISNLAEQESSRREKQESMPLTTFATEVKTLLSAMNREPCLIKTKDWWTYELCPGTTIKQYHMEEGRPQGNILILGNYNHDHEWTEEDRKKNLLHHSQFYANGSECDLTGDLRKTEVKYYCDPATIFDAITEIHEPLSCEYVISVATSKICSLPELKPVPPNSPKEIKCHPALSPSDYEKYEAFEKERVKVLEKQQLASREKQRQKMLQFIGADVPGDVDINTDAGLRFLEDLVEQKLADNVVLKLNTLIDGVVFTAGGVAKGSQSQPKNKKKAFLDMIDEIVMVKKFKLLLPQPKLTKSDHDETKFDLEGERKVRSDAVTEDDMLDELKTTFSQLQNDKKTELSSLQESKEFQENLQESLAEIVRETEQELGAKLDPNKQGELENFAETIKDLIRKVDNAEAEIKRVNAEIEKVQNIIDNQDYDYGDYRDVDYADEVAAASAQDYGGGEREHYKHDGKLSVKRELRQEDYYDDFDGEGPGQYHQASDDIKVVVKELPSTHVEGLENSAASEARIAKRVESLVRSKLSKANGGLEVGGRQVQIKVVTLNDPEVVEGLAAANGEGETSKASGAEAQQFQDMIYNLMIGDQKSFDDIDGQRKSEKNYKFQWDQVMAKKSPRDEDSADSALPQEENVKQASGVDE